MKFGIIGSGDVAQAIGHGLIQTGHEVLLGSRQTGSEKLKDWQVKNGERARTGSFKEAADFGEVVFLATLWSGTENALSMSEIHSFSGKILVDVTNPLDFSAGIPPKLSLGFSDSAGETVQRLLPDIRVVKALNIVGNGHMYKPSFPEGVPTMFICGNDDEAKQTVREILTAFGWDDIVDMGRIEKARLLEPLAMLWIEYGFLTNTWGHAFKLLRK